MPRNRILGYRAQTRSKITAYILCFAGLILFMGVLQVSFFGRIKLFGAVPDLMLLTVLCISFCSGRYAGAIVGTAGGFFIEAIGGQGISLLPIAFMLMGYLIGHFSHTVGQKRYHFYLFHLTCALFLRAVLTVIYACLTYEIIRLPVILMQAVLPEAAATALCGLVVYFPIRLLCRALEGK